ncbi:MAG: glycosyltransferase [Proteobacteria bacterium ST_bin15]|nr:MAG: glycosyltransferase [Proteobacteria bacterium ST_bin15]
MTMDPRSLHDISQRPELSVVVPMHNEAANLAPLLARLIPVLRSLDHRFEILFVDDGSRDDSFERVRAAALTEPRVRAIALSRNFGKEVAIAAGLAHARGNAVILMDGDLQHPPETIRDFVVKWREGYRMVYGIRRDRETDSLLRRWFSDGFYRLFAALSPTQLPRGAGDFRLIDRKAVDALNAIHERTRFTKGLYSWIGFKAVGVEFDVEERADGGGSKWNARRLFSFALDGITAFSTLPLRVWTYIGTAVSMLALLLALYFVAETLIWGVAVPGFPSLIVSVMFFAGVQLITLGVLGEYIGRIFVEVKRRPLYIVAEEIGQVSTASPLSDQVEANS